VDPTGSCLEPTDRAVVAFAAKVAVDPASVGSEDVAALRALGLTDGDVADVVFAVAARCFFATVLDAGGAEADAQLGGSFDAETRARLAVGRPFAPAPG
jgi:alkylhydroperoxidase family enzyme